MLCPVVGGRDAELAALKDALTAALSGAGKCAVLVGELGIGKSRLARSAASFAADLQVRVLTGRAVPASATTACRPLTEALLQLLRGREIADDAAMAA